MSRNSNTSERREQITEALLHLMARGGFEATPVSAIAAAAGLNTGLIHYHFRNKVEILISATDRLVADHQTQLIHALARAGEDPLAQLDAFITFHLDAGEDADAERLACWLVISAETMRHPDVRVAFEDALEATSLLLQTIIGRGVDQNRFACEDPVAAAAALVAVIQGYFVVAATARSLIPPKSAAPSVRAMARGLLSLSSE